MFLRRRLMRAQLAAAEALELTRRVVTLEHRGVKQIDAMILESRMLFSASPLAAALIENVEPTADSIDASFSFDNLLGDGQADGLDHLDVADASDLQSAYTPWLESELLRTDEVAPLSPALRQSLELGFVDTGAEDDEQLLTDLLAHVDESKR